MQKKAWSIVIISLVLQSIFLTLSCPIIVQSPDSYSPDPNYVERWRLSDEDGPIMEYYPRKYFTDGYEHHDLTVIVVARDSDGVHSVMIHYSQKDSNNWSLSPLLQDDENPDLYSGYLVFEENETEPYSHESVFQIYYVANDTLGNTSQSPLFEFGAVFVPVTSDAGPDLYETPDLWYLVGTTGHEITWMDDSLGRTYTLYKDGLLLERHRWHGELTINVDGLPLGDHLYSLEVWHGCCLDTENVTVHVVEELPIAGVILVFILLVIMVFFRKQTRV
jgi:hypothetical protein